MQWAVSWWDVWGCEWAVQSRLLRELHRWVLLSAGVDDQHTVLVRGCVKGKWAAGAAHCGAHYTSAEARLKWQLLLLLLLLLFLASRCVSLWCCAVPSGAHAAQCVLQGQGLPLCAEWDSCARQVT